MTENPHTLDARGLNCPLPILRTRKAIAALTPGEVLQVIATDRGSVKDIASFCTQTGHERLEHTEAEGSFLCRIRKH